MPPTPKSMKVVLLSTPSRAQYLQQRASPDVTVHARDIIGVPPSIESVYESYMDIPRALEAVIRAKADGYDAVLTDRFADPGIDAARELVKIPVLGPGESSMLVAASLGHRFAIITVLDSVVPMIRALARRVGVGKHAWVGAYDRPIGPNHAR